MELNVNWCLASKAITLESGINGESGLSTKNSIQAVTFDMDGTMFNTEDIYDFVSEMVLQRRNRHFDQELKLKMMGLPGDQAFQIMIDHCGLKDSVQTLAAETHELFTEVLPSQIEKMPGLARLLKFLSEREIPCAVATSSSRQLADLSISTCGMTECFQFVLTSEDVDQGKPHPEIYLKAANRFGIETSQMLVFEDSPIGSRAAVDSGALTVAVPCSHTEHCNFDHVPHRANTLEDELIYGLLG